MMAGHSIQACYCEGSWPHLCGSHTAAHSLCSTQKQAGASLTLPANSWDSHRSSQTQQQGL